MRKLLLTLTSLIASSAFAAEVNLYTYRHYEGDQKLFDSFTEQTGIKVNVIKAKADSLIERIKAEGEQSPADLLITADAGRLARAQEMGLLQSVESATLAEKIPANLRDPENHWFGFTVRARVILYNPEKVSPDELSTYEALSDPKWKGRIVVRSSSNIYNQSLLAATIEHKGKKAAMEWAKSVRGNMARDPRGSDRDQIRAVAAGIADLAIANTYYYGLLANSPDEKDREVASKVKIFFPNQDTTGTHINISGGGVCKHAPNKENAVKLLEFLVSEEAQKSFPATTYEYPLDLSAEHSETLKALGGFIADRIPLSILGANNADAVKAFTLAGWK